MSYSLKYSQSFSSLYTALCRVALLVLIPSPRAKGIVPFILQSLKSEGVYSSFPSLMLS
jgi:hypothetical protein